MWAKKAANTYIDTVLYTEVFHNNIILNRHRILSIEMRAA